MVIAADDARRAGQEAPRMMTGTTDTHVPQRSLIETLVLHVAASPVAVLGAADRLASTRDPYAGVQLLGERVFGVSWHPKPGAPGRIDVVFDLRIEMDATDGCYIASTQRFTGSDDAAREALLRNWSTIRANTTAITTQTLRAIKRAAETANRKPARDRIAAVLAA